VGIQGAYEAKVCCGGLGGSEEVRMVLEVLLHSMAQHSTARQFMVQHDMALRRCVLRRKSAALGLVSPRR
jgi:hypothetical protein